MNRAFVVTVASEKGGVGKTTIATNLAIYLKALREDLPVTIASFDNHFSVDQMFALGERPQQGVAELLETSARTVPVVLGQYGVQFIASARRLTPPVHPPSWLRRTLHGSGLDGLLILDTRPILDWFTEAALLAADLVLVPVKDRAALVNAAALRQILAEAERADRLWLLPSLVDSRARLSATIRVHEFLAYAARERDYQVLDFYISKSPKVEGLASGFSSCIRPVLTHARNTAVHGQLKRLAEFILSRFDSEKTGSPVIPAETNPLARATDGEAPYLASQCPVCRQHIGVDGRHPYCDLRSRRRGAIHPACLVRLLGDLNLELTDSSVDLMALTIDGQGIFGTDCRLTLHFCDASGGVLGSEDFALEQHRPWRDWLTMMIGRHVNETDRALVLIDCAEHPPGPGSKVYADGDFARKRRQVARELRRAGLF